MSERSERLELLAIAEAAATEASEALKAHRADWSVIAAEEGREVKIDADKRAEALILAALQRAAPFPIMRADAARDPLPHADVAISTCLAHHLDDDQLIAMIRNVGRSCRRFLLLDLVRHRLPLVLFRTFAPLAVPALNVSDGCQSIRRSYTPPELRALIERALDGTAARFRHTVAPCSIRQIADIRY